MRLWKKFFGGGSKLPRVAPDTLQSVPLAVPSQGLAAGALSINPKDGAEMVYVPAGEFLMGDGDFEFNPLRTVTLDAFWIYKHDVTADQYRTFCHATGRKMLTAQYRWSKRDHPVVNVTWEDAKTYCDWAGVSLPTEAQWEKAARGTDGRKYPWLNEWDPGKLSCFAGSMRKDTSPVGSFPAGASPYGCLDVEGNVYQWCADYCDLDYLKSAPSANPTGPPSGFGRVLRGGPWFLGAPNYFRRAFRAGGDARHSGYYIGFRAARVGVETKADEQV